ncbi:hypothetical protein FSARC_11223 [Fusarium sarcochroum]|uniref:Uncharacterized protein n=1 Tax=Fusarium sarcochroum TaxID=1208366 RepID=A0A8H4TGW8_9HYPO|nr:hypothetical protein FSARC_11223 [Fusarium sarcochroum]
MPKAPPPQSRPDGCRPSPYGAWASRFSSRAENRSLPSPARPAPPSLRPFELPSGSFVNPFEVPLQHNLPTTARDDNRPARHAGQNPQGKNGPPRRFFQESLKPTGQEKDRPKRDLTMVDSMRLQSISRYNSRGRIPGLSIHSNSRGGGVQFNVFTKVPNLSKTIAFNVKSEEALLAAYRHVKAMNPSAAVGGVMFSVAPKNDGPAVEVADVPWGNFAGRGDGPRTFTINSYQPSRYRGY